MAKTSKNKTKQWRRIKKHVTEDGNITRIGRSVRNRMVQWNDFKASSDLILGMMQKVNLITIKHPVTIDDVNNEGEVNATV